MRKCLTKKLLAAIMAVMVAGTVMTPVKAEAAVKVAAVQTIYRDSTSGISYENICVSGLSKTMKLKSIKSSNKNVMKPYYVSYGTTINSYATEYLDAAMQSNNYKKDSKNYYALIGCQNKKSGTATISFKIGKKTYKTKVAVKKYTNPLKTVNIAGIKNGKSTNLASKLNKKNQANLENMSKRTAKITIVPKSGWKIKEVTVFDAKTQTYTEIRNYNGTAKATLHAGKFEEDSPYKVTIKTMDKTGAIVTSVYYVNYSEDSHGNYYYE